MTDPTFNLIDEPWIPVLRLDGVMDEVSLFDVIARGDEFTQIVGEVPTQVFAIQRVVLAALHRAVDGPRDMGEWRTICKDWAGTVDIVRAYLDRFHDRFYLFHPTMPFFQVADLRTAKNEASGLEKLIIDVPNGAPFFTTRIGPGLDRIPFSEAMRWLIHVHAFDPSGIRSGAVGDSRQKNGKGYPIGPGWAGLIGGVTIVGDTVRQTLQLNLIVPAPARVGSGPDDRPPWERDQLTEKAETGLGRPQPRGFVDLYTWQTRRVRLVGDEHGVTGLVLAQGDPMTPQNRQDVEPMTAWRHSGPQSKKFGHVVYMPRQHDPQRAFWRGLEALLPHVDLETASKGPAGSLPPGILLWASKVRAELEAEGERIVRLRATGIDYGSQNSTVGELVDDALAVPMSLLGEDAAELELVAVQAVKCADDTAWALGSLAKNLALAAGADVENNGPADRAREQFYAALDTPFRDWLVSLSIDEPVEQAAARWQREVRRLALDLSSELLSSTGPAAWVGREARGRHIDSGIAEVWFRVALKKALPRGDSNEMEEVTP